MIPEIKTKHLIVCTMCDDTLEVITLADLKRVVDSHIRLHRKTNRYQEDAAMSVTVIYERPHEDQQEGLGSPVGRLLEVASERGL